MLSHTSRAYIKPLTGIRAVAAHMVMFHHFIYDGKLELHFAHLYTGLTLFFVLSGFLITYHNYDSVAQKTFNLKDYFAKRVARIYPTYFLILFIYAFFTTNDEVSSSLFWFLNLTLLKGWVNDYIYSGLGQSWTLTHEETFYFIAPSLFFFVYRNRFPLWAVALPSIAFGILLTFIGTQTGTPHIAGDLYSATQTGFFFMLLPFLAGSWAAMIVTGHRPSLQNFAKKARFLTYSGFLLSLICLEMLEHYKPFEMNFGIFQPAQPLINLIALPLSLGIFFVGLSFEKTLLSRFLSTRTMELLGKSSYVLYLIHSGVIANFLFSFIPNEWGGLGLVVFTLAINAVSIALHLAFEEPIVRFVRERFSKLRTGTPDNVAIKTAA